MLGKTTITVALVCWVALEAVLVGRERRRRSDGTSQDDGSWRATYGGCALAAVIAIVTGVWVPLVDLPGGEARRLLGSGLAFGGIALRTWSVVTLGAFFRVAVTIDDAHRVVTAGPYRVLRHPSYTGLIAIVTGLALGFGDAVGLLACLTLAPAALVHRIHVEERALRASLGAAYDEFAAGRARLLPLVW